MKRTSIQMFEPILKDSLGRREIMSILASLPASIGAQPFVNCAAYNGTITQWLPATSRAAGLLYAPRDFVVAGDGIGPLPTSSVDYESLFSYRTLPALLKTQGFEVAQETEKAQSH
jgi:hypothetical protein